MRTHTPVGKFLGLLGDPQSSQHLPHHGMKSQGLLLLPSLDVEPDDISVTSAWAGCDNGLHPATNCPVSVCK